MTGAHTVVAALVPLVPEGLVLLTSLTFAVAAVRLARLGALAQRINAVESLAAVDVVCVDKTGTLTDNRLSVVAFEVAGDDGRGRVARDRRPVRGLGGRSQRDGPRDVRRCAAGTPGPVAEVPFSSANKWSALTLPQIGTIVLGAPDVLSRHGIAIGPELAAASTPTLPNAAGWCSGRRRGSGSAETCRGDSRARDRRFG